MTAPSPVIATRRAGVSLAGVSLVVAWVVLGAALGRAWPAMSRAAERPTYVRVDAWLQSAACLQQYGVPLVVCDDLGTLLPIEHAAQADDRGHALLANLIALTRPRPVTRLTLVRLNLAVNAIALVALSAALWTWAGLRWTAVLSVPLGLPWGVPGPYASADAFMGFFAAYCLAGIPICWIAALVPARPRIARALVGGVLSLAALAGAVLLRQPIGVAGMLAALALLMGRALYWRPLRAAWLLGCVAAAGALLLPALATRAVLAARTVLWRVPESRLVLDHGISHNLYLGLGVYPNRWGIEWDDDAGKRAVARIDPSVEYVSPRYYAILWGLYLDIVRRHPGEVARLYARKARETVAYGGLWWKLPLLLGVSGLVVVAAGRAETAGGWASIGAAALVALVLVQGVLALPWPLYFYPAVFGAHLALTGGLETLTGLLVARVRRAVVQPA